MRIRIPPKDLRRTTFHCGGPGGQNVNKTESGVRWLHVPTGLVAQSCSTPSQIKNSEMAVKLLLGKILRHYEGLQEAGYKKAYADKPDAAFGNQIRSYVLQGSEQRVVDHASGIKAHPRLVLDGQIDAFLEAAMKSRASGYTKPPRR